MRTPWQKRPWYRRVGWWDLLVGVALIALGAVSLMNPDLAVTGLTYAYGIAGVIVGVADILRYIRVERFTGLGPLVSLVSGVLSVMSGVVILVHPAWELQCFPCCSLCGLWPTASHGWRVCPRCVWRRGEVCTASLSRSISSV